MAVETLLNVALTAAKAKNSCDDGYRDASGNQAIFDRRLVARHRTTVRSPLLSAQQVRQLGEVRGHLPCLIAEAVYLPTSRQVWRPPGNSTLAGHGL